MLDRRTLAASAFAMPFLGPVRAPRADDATQAFAVDRNGSPIGRHTLRFTRDGRRLSVAIDIQLEVKLAFITLYRYRHTNRELWEDGRLLSFASRTDDNGTPHRVEARRAGEVILVESDAGRIEAPGDALPSTYWHRRFLDAPVWIDTQRGRLLNCQVTPRGVSRVSAAGDDVAADRFAVTGDLTLDLWYAQERWVKLDFKGEDGSVIDYRLEQAGPQLATLAG